MHAVHIVSERSAELRARRIRAWFVSRDRTCSSHSPCLLCSLLPPQRSSNVIGLHRSMSKQLIAHIRPEFLHNVEGRVQRYLLPPLVRSISKRFGPLPDC
jgi:hypothetical protein